MIIWLASYPRSGNTLLRMILKSVFELSSFSKHGDAEDIAADLKLAELVGHQTITSDLQQMRTSHQLNLVKTHDPPEDDSAAIYIVRDGRAACRSFHQYLQDFPPLGAGFSMSDIAAGFTPFGSWSDHLQDWDPQHRPNTLLLTYENLIADPTAQIDRIAAFLNRPRLHPWENNFARLQEINRRFFPLGKNDTELPTKAAAIFWDQHGQWMKQLGYPVEEPTTQGRAAYRTWISNKGRQFYNLSVRTGEAELQVLQQAGQQHRQQKQFAVALQEKNQKVELLTGAVQELNTRLRMLLTSRLLHAGWFLGLGSTPYWSDPGQDELTDLIEMPEKLPRKEPAANEMERALLHLYEKGFRPGVVLDVGAAKGYWSCMAGDLWKEAEFFMLDPLVVSEPNLQKLCENPRFHYLLLAVGDWATELRMKVADDPDSSSLLVPPDTEKFHTVQVQTIDALLDAGKIKLPNLVKLDVQGFELKALQGGSKLFDHVEVFIVEANLFEFMPGCPRLHELTQFMAARGFYPFDFAGLLRRPFENDLGQVDVVFVSHRSKLVASNRWLSDVPRLEHPEKISVIICTKDPQPAIFSRVLASLDLQTITKDRFEIIIVDNASEPSLDDGFVKSQFQLTPVLRYSEEPGSSDDLPGSSEYLRTGVVEQVLKVKVVREDTPGLGRARCTGISNAGGQLLVFVDDDNFLAPDYLEQALAIAIREPRIGLFGGISQAELAVPIPKWKEPVLPYLGIRDHGDTPITKLADRWGKWEPIGAGMVARRAVAERFIEMFQGSVHARQLGRSGSTLLSGEDSLMARAAYREGLACSYQPTLRLTHYLQPSRLTTKYMQEVLEGHGRSFVLLQRALGKPVPPMKWGSVIALLFYRLKDVGRAGFITWRWEIGYAKEAKKATHVA